MRGGVYVAFLISALIAWFMKRHDNKRKEKTKNPLEGIEIDNPFESLKSPNWHLRLKAVQMLAKMSAIEAIPSLIIAIADEDSDVREAAANALTAFNEESVPYLLKTLKEADANARETALNALAAIRSKAALEGIATALLNDESAWIRIPAAEVLGKTGDEKYIAVLTQALQDTHEGVYEAVVQALKQIGTKKALLAINKHPYSSTA